MAKRNSQSWKAFFLASLRRQNRKYNDQLLIKNQKGGALAVKIISPTMQATEQAREDMKEGQFGDGLLVRKQRPIKGGVAKKKKTTKKKSSSKKKTD